MKFFGIRHLSLAVIVACGSAPEAVRSQTGPKQWGVSGGWTILIDPDAGNGCYMESILADDTLVQLGVAPDRNGGFFAAYNADWTNLVEGYVGTVHFDFGPSLFGGEYVGAERNGLPGGYAFFNNPEFVKEFGKRNTVSVKDENGGTLEFNLTGTMKAINAVRNCDAEQTR